MVTVSIGIVKRGEQVLLVKRKFPEGNLSWQFPGGKIECNEKPKFAAEREVLEETNVKCKVIDDLGVRVHPHNDITIHYYLCDYESGKIKRKKSEVSAVKWVLASEIKRFITSDIFTPVSNCLDSLKITGKNKKKNNRFLNILPKRWHIEHHT